MPDGKIGMPGEKGVLVVVAGRQRVGKTTVANALVQYYSALGCRFEVWNADQQNRSHSLSSFFADALTPPPGGLVDGRMWLEQRLRDQVRRRSNAVLDPGGGWTSFASLVREIPLVTALDAEGIRVVALFCAGAERADLDYLEHYAEADLFMPTSTMIGSRSERLPATSARCMPPWTGPTHLRPTGRRPSGSAGSPGSVNESRRPAPTSPPGG